MRTKSLVFLFMFFMNSEVFAGNNCFIAKTENDILKIEGAGCNERSSPDSTFKIPLALIGYDAGILKNTVEPTWSLREPHDVVSIRCNGKQTPETWMINSCVWYSRVIVKSLGLNKVKEYIKQFHYGNMNVESKQPNELSDFWLSSTLKISPQEQINFLESFTNRKLGISSKAYEMTKKIMFIQSLSNDWKLYGKTGMNHDETHAWFVGFIERDNKKILFVNHTVSGVNAKEDAIQKITTVIQNIQ